MSNLLQGLVSSAVTASVTVYGVYKLGKTAYTINNNGNNNLPEAVAPNTHKKEAIAPKYRYFAEKTVSDKIIFVPKQFTERAIYEDFIMERFESNKQLFYYLRRRSNMEAIHGDLRIFEFNRNVQILIFCTDLHCNNRLKSKLYVIGTKNDKEINNSLNNNNNNNNFGHNPNKKTIEKWKMSEYFMTAQDIENKYGINRNDLPLGSNNKLQRIYNETNINRLIYTKNNVSIQNYTELKPIKTKITNINKREYTIYRHELYEAIKKANIFKPIISFSEDKNKYYIDMILLVNIARNKQNNKNWIGIIFRDYKGDKNKFIPIDIAIDCYDIRNKMMLFAPPINNKQSMEMNKYQNNISTLNLIENINNNNQYNNKMIHNNNNNKQSEIADLERRLFEANQRLKALENQVKEQKITIEQQSRDIVALKEQNNHYFQQCLDPNSNILPHSMHLEAAKQPSITIYVKDNKYYHLSNDNNDNLPIYINTDHIQKK